ncbi:MAG: hypothetical protein HOE83_11245 [Alphaproteobacteria bacterium]|jgi:hypothetical protein|nr:hypothetical protein [Alphaproteobacteria bacterium]
MSPLAIIKLVNGLMSLIQFFGGMFRDEGLRKDGENRVIAANAGRMIKARDKANAKVKSFDDALLVIRGKLPKPDADEE